MNLKSLYEHKYKKLLLIPFLLLVLALGQIIVQYSVTGDFVNKGISLKGGSTITLDYNPNLNLEDMQLFFDQNFPLSNVVVRTLSSAGKTSSIAIDSNTQEDTDLNSLLKSLKSEYNIKTEDMNVEVIGSSLGNSFFRQTFIALIIAFFLMGLVVFLYFRTLAPSLAVILAAFSDIVVTLAIFNLTGIKLTTAGIAAFLMLIGYSVDTDILLSSRMLKRKDIPVMERIYSAMRTGLTMSATTLSAILVALIFVQSEVVKQIMIILFIGLLVDLVMTWIQNVGILRLYLKKKNKDEN